MADDEVIQTLYVIRHHPTGHFLPCLPKGRRNGHSFSEPEKLGDGVTPRLFNKHSSAKIALTMWLQGQQFFSYDGDGCSSFDKLVPVQTRKREEMEIVRVNIVLNPVLRFL